MTLSYCILLYTFIALLARRQKCTLEYNITHICGYDLVKTTAFFSATRGQLFTYYVQTQVKSAMRISMRIAKGEGGARSPQTGKEIYVYIYILSGKANTATTSTARAG